MPDSGVIDQPTDEQLEDTARRMYARDGEVEIDPGAKVSRGEDPGAYVQAWVWVYFRDVPGFEDYPEP